MQSQQPQLPQPISRIFVRVGSEEVRTVLLSRLPIHPGDVLSDDLLLKTMQAAKDFNHRYEVMVGEAVGREAFLRLPPDIRTRLSPPACDDGVNVTIYDPASLPRRIRLEQIEPVSAIHPACHEGVAGVVQVAIVIGKDGTVMQASPTTGPGVLLAPAVDVVKQWKYRPTLLNGIPVEVQTVVEVDFSSSR